MGNRNIVNGLALIGAVIVLIGVVFAANTALAETEASRSPSATTESLRSEHKESAEKANRDAADDAATNLAREARLDLEIRLLDRTSTLIARAS